MLSFFIYNLQEQDDGFKVKGLFRLDPSMIDVKKMFSLEKIKLDDANAKRACLKDKICFWLMEGCCDGRKFSVWGIT